ncbi:prolyl aminopeptidase [Bdellovibrio bacteriovorus]|uniref:Proline iminopeptidase n=1 Tax=Bdellovibrio bacteriovorus TaxID=959 RepID=A0A150WP68_BDEBC|nr:prolyl aminopeptidase [Bdellovibrio bacteriovorus]KYG66282.1 prolyl aminopeptidase [Bdellovibrio bacteriovorus]
MRDFYPPIEPINKGFLKVSDIHNLYWEECGNPQGQPVVFLHGGPGGGIGPDLRRFFDPKAYRIILFDQRGSGSSTPNAELKDNTTWDLIKDIETLREMFKIDTWVVFGGSWGSTLALAYAITHPDRVKGLILRGIFLCRPSEIKWFYQEGASQIFPDVWDEYLKPIPPNERHDMVTAYYKRLTDPSAEVRLTAAKAWSKWEAATSRLFVSPEAIDEFDDPEFALSFARIECHYFTNNAFFKTDNWLLENVDKIRHIPGVIVQGRYDVVCPARSAWDLHKAWPEAKFTFIADAGHAAAEPGTKSALIEATDAFRNL